MLLQKPKIDGSIPLKYKQGKIKKNIYRSECLGYTFHIPDDFKIQDEKERQSHCNQKDICDFFCIETSGTNVGVYYSPSDGSVVFADDNFRDMIANAMVQKMNEQFGNDRKSTYYGLVNFCGKPCAHVITHFQQHGKNWISESYQYHSTYYSLSFVFTYLSGNEWHVDKMKALFLPLL